MTYYYACDACGAGKKLYYKRYGKSMKEGEPITEEWVESDRIQTEPLRTETDPIQCIVCGGIDLEIIKIEK